MICSGKDGLDGGGVGMQRKERVGVKLKEEQEALVIHWLLEGEGKIWRLEESERHYHKCEREEGPV